MKFNLITPLGKETKGLDIIILTMYASVNEVNVICLYQRFVALKCTYPEQVLIGVLPQLLYILTLK